MTKLTDNKDSTASSYHRSRQRLSLRLLLGSVGLAGSVLAVVHYGMTYGSIGLVLLGGLAGGIFVLWGIGWLKGGVAGGTRWIWVAALVILFLQLLAGLVPAIR